MEQVLIKAAQLLLSLSILVVLHEFGHFAFARLFKTRVEKFYLFFDPWFSLFKTKRGETEYGIGWLPLGGYVKISGMIDESMDKEAMSQEPQPWEFRSKKPYQRLLIMLGGVMMNFIFAFIIYIGVLYAWGTQYLPTENVKYGISVHETGEAIGLQNGDQILSVDNQYIEDFQKIMPTVILEGAKTIQVLRDGQKVDVEISDDDLALLIKSRQIISPRLFFAFEAGKIQKGSQAELAGLQKGDEFKSVNGQTFTYYDQFAQYLKAHAGQSINLNVLRDGVSKDIQATVSEEGTLGFSVAFLEEASSFLEFETIEYGFFESIPAGIKRGVNTVKDYLKQFKLIFSPKTKAYESLGGFIAIGNIFPGAWDWHSFWNMTAFLSIILAVMNLLPIPALDGGHVTFLLYEIVSGRKPGDKFMEYAQITGMIILLTLVLYANGNDVVKLINQYF
ncbi:RIP metalloprotease RseP [Sunxiuqinia elliptica]|uniref:Zinc metalloprotease n=1 Tax=Sunxiuqinia elliptica TaxID=655355 RepID=A0A4R6H700_9BACT|nr:RIP metalloprotease RseP [Sunxiuqinia elliptica]TDO03754.1 regulator of sigma E protease [Sunxiuqinia elliptica]TDO62035.1 regulator of sigma E protease [Sunxiuqinia elliptica]